MEKYAETPKPPYYAVIFTSIRSEISEGYDETSDHMLDLVHKQSGFLGAESFRNENGFGVTISYWKTLEDIKEWKQQSDHLRAQHKGKAKWYTNYKVRICKVERDYFFKEGF